MVSLQKLFLFLCKPIKKETSHGQIPEEGGGGGGGGGQSEPPLKITRNGLS